MSSPNVASSVDQGFISGRSARMPLASKIGYLLAGVLLLFVLIVIVVAGALNINTDDWWKRNGAANNNNVEEEKPNYSQKVPVLITNATLWDGTGKIIPNCNILIDGGLVKAVGESIDPSSIPEGTVTHNAMGRIVTPGLVDMHSHVGVYPFPSLQANSDGNEMTNPTTPQVRAIDAFDPEDLAIPQIVAGGVTTSQVLPGSGNVMGGQSVMVKMRGKTVEEMRIKGAPQTLKMACGENPKRVYGSKGMMPMTRMGSAWVMREKFAAAQDLMRRQDAAAAASAAEKPQNLALEPLVQLLRGNALLQCHCYKVHDLEMMIRLSKEFNFSIAAFHHALEAYKIPDVMRENNITVALFADLWGYKMEAYDASVYAPKILHEAGVKLALKSDHPVTHSKDLIQHAQKAHYYGLDEQAALAAVTRVPAAGIGLGHRIGTVEVGKEGDVVIWDSNPIKTLGAQPLKVFIEGELVVENKKKKQMLAEQQQQQQQQKPLDNNVAKTITTTTTTTTMKRLNSTVACPAAATITSSKYAVVGATVYTMMTGNQPLESATIVVENGTIKCVGTTMDCQVPSDAQVFEMNGGIVTPGMIESASGLGLMEILAEDSTGDGVAYAGYDQKQIRAIDGIRMNSRHMKAALTAGVTVSITEPLGNALLSGISAAFYTDGLVVDDALISEVASLGCNFGNIAKNHPGHQGSIATSISGQASALRLLLTAANQTLASNEDANTSTTNPLVWVLRGDIRLVCRANQADDIASLLRLQREFGGSSSSSSSFKLAIMGGGEAHLLAERLAAAQVPVILIAGGPNGGYPMESWDMLRYSDESAAILRRAKVQVAFAMGDQDAARNLRWEAGLAVKNGLAWTDALAGVTKTVADIFGLTPHGVGVIAEGTKANFVLFDEDPLSYKSKVALVAIGSNVHCV